MESSQERLVVCDYSSMAMGMRIAHFPRVSIIEGTYIHHTDRCIFYLT
eukprot:SAG25_NODE_6564_length_550_cov_1.146341_2_plen_47_part_01